ncbi:hypothetical protein ABIF72_001358 [Bradyrhizobium japonicum]
MLLAINRQIQGIPSAGASAANPKASVVPKKKLFKLQRGHPKHSVRIFTHRRTSDTVWLSRDPSFADPLGVTGADHYV